MGELSLGQAIALGTQAQVKTQNTFSALNDAVKYKNQIDFQKEQRKAAEQAKKDQLKNALASRLVIKTDDLIPHFQEQATNEAANGMAEMKLAIDRGDAVGVNEWRTKTEQRLGNIKAQNDQAKQFLEAERNGKIIVPDEVKAALSERYSTGNPKLRKALKDHPEYANFIGMDDTGNYSFNYVNNIDLPKMYGEVMGDKSITNNMNTEKFRKKLDNNTDFITYKADDELLGSVAGQKAADPHVQANVIYKHKKEYDNNFNVIAQQHPELPEAALKTMAVASIIDNGLAELNERHATETKTQPKAVAVAKPKFTTVAVEAEAIPYDYRAFNKKYGTNYNAEQFGSTKQTMGNSGYIAYEKIGAGGDTESIQLNINGKQVRPIGYKVQDGKLYMTASEPITVTYRNDPGNPKEALKSRTEYVVSENIPVNKEAAANIAGHLGFESINGFRDDVKDRMQKNGINTKSKAVPVKSTIHPLPAGKPKTVKQNGVVYTWNDSTGAYE